jgi:hypothetical protein
MTKIIGISGRKQSGKNTTANYITGSILRQQEAIKDFYLSEDGKLIINTTDANQNVGWGELDLLRHDYEFVSQAERIIWPFVKIHHFADYLKKICIDLFDLTPAQVYGSDDNKNTKTPYNMTAREFLQYFGTDIMRKIKDTVWVDYTLKNILTEQSSVAIIPDVRFPNEVQAIKNAGGTMIRLTRDVHNSNHPCETALDQDKFDWMAFDFIIDNEGKDITTLVSDLEKITALWSIT